MAGGSEDDRARKRETWAWASVGEEGEGKFLAGG